MRKTLSLIPLLFLFAAIGAPSAHADAVTNATINFTVIRGSDAAPTGSFVYDNTTNMFTSFTVNWDSKMFDFTTTANDFGDSSASGCAAAPSGDPAYEDLLCTSLTWSTGGFNGFNDFIITPGTLQGGEGDVIAEGGATAADFGTALVVVTPEPGTASLVLIGSGLLGLMMVMRRRSGRSLPHATRA